MPLIKARKTAVACQKFGKVHDKIHTRCVFNENEEIVNYFTIMALKECWCCATGDVCPVTPHLKSDAAAVLAGAWPAPDG